MHTKVHPKVLSNHTNSIIDSFLLIFRTLKNPNFIVNCNFSPCTDQQSNNRNSAPPGSLKNLTINNHKYLKPNGSHETQRNGTAKVSFQMTSF